jgi:A/G-specific adenine glycosylase
MNKPFFTEKLLEWFATHHRPMPWKGEKNPYLVWLSEIILQQTTVRQGLSYYEKFVDRYPSVKNLADAPEDDVMKLWEGLGYYARARHMHATAKLIAYDLNGSFPNTYEDILKLKGVGEYTAAAIASFAYDLPHAVVDGNVYRVLSRYFGIDEPIDSSKAKSLFTGLANELLDKNRPADFNQAMMDFGATHCKPANPACKDCPLNTNCFALNKNKIETLPIKLKKIQKKTRYFNYLILNKNNNVLIQKRMGKDIWQNLYEFPMLESDDFLEKETILLRGAAFLNLNNNNMRIIRQSQPYQQMLTHRKIIATFWEIECEKENFEKNNEMFEINRKELFKFAFPKIIDTYLKETILTLF